MREAVNGEQYIFLLNYSEKTQEITAHKEIMDVITETTLCGKHMMQPYDVLVLKK